MTCLIHLDRMKSVILASVAAAMLGVALSAGGGGHVAAQSSGPSLAIDAGPSGNGPTAIERVEDCVEVSTGDRFEMDIVVEDVTALLAWEIPIDYQPDVVTIVGQDVKMFQQANEGSAVIDLSAKLPDDTGFHKLAAFDSADPDSPDSGAGVLARITLEAVGEGESPVRFGNRDFDNDGTLDQGSLLRDTDTGIIGDENEDSFFDGEQTDALVVVDGECPSGTTVGEPSKVNVTPPTAEGDDSVPWAALAGAIGAAAVVLLLGAAYLLSRRRRKSAG